MESLYLDYKMDPTCPTPLEERKDIFSFDFFLCLAAISFLSFYYYFIICFDFRAAGKKGLLDALQA